MAKAGNWTEIEEKYGEAWVIKARTYLDKKQGYVSKLKIITEILFLIMIDWIITIYIHYGYIYFLTTLFTIYIHIFAILDVLYIFVILYS